MGDFDCKNGKLKLLQVFFVFTICKLNDHFWYLLNCLAINLPVEKDKAAYSVTQW